MSGYAALMAVLIAVFEFAAGVRIIYRRVGSGSVEEFIVQAPLSEFLKVQAHMRLCMMSLMMGSIMLAGS